MAKEKKQKESLEGCTVIHIDPNSEEWKERIARIRRDLERNGSEFDKDIIYRKNNT